MYIVERNHRNSSDIYCEVILEKKDQMKTPKYNYFTCNKDKVIIGMVPLWVGWFSKEIKALGYSFTEIKLDNEKY